MGRGVYWMFNAKDYTPPNWQVIIVSLVNRWIRLCECAGLCGKFKVVVSEFIYYFLSP